MTLRSGFRLLRPSARVAQRRPRVFPWSRRQGLWRFAWGLAFALAALLGVILAFNL